MTQAKLADGTVLNFPDGTPDEVIQRTVKQQVQAQKGGAPLAPPQGVVTDTTDVRDPVSGVPGGVTGTPEPQPNPIVDAISSVPGALANVGAGIATLPVTAGKGVMGAELLGQDVYNLITKGRPLTHEEAAQKKQEFLNPGPDANIVDRGTSWLIRKAFEGQDQAFNAINENLYQPKTDFGGHAKDLTEFVASALLPSKATSEMSSGSAKLSNYVADVASHGVLPGAAYTFGKPYMGQDAALLSALGMSGLATGIRTGSSPEVTYRRATAGTEPETWNKAVALDENPHGIDLTVPEALAEASGQSNHPALKVQRFAEASLPGSEVMAPFMAKRADQVDAAVKGGLDEIAPVSADVPSIGPRVAKAAEQTLREAEQARTSAASPHYQAANASPVMRGDMDRLIADMDAEIARDTTGLVSGPLKELRGNLIAEQAQPGQAATRTEGGQPGIYRHQPAVPATPERPALDVDNIDRARIAWRDKVNAKNLDKGAIDATARQKITPFLDRIDGILEKNPDFVKGKQEYMKATVESVDPLKRGPVGNLKKAKTTEAVGNQVLPYNPKPNTADLVKDAITRVKAKTDQFPAAVRQRLDQIFSDVGQSSGGGNREAAGSRFETAVRGSPALAENLNKVLSAVGADPAKFGDLLDVLRATGRRLTQGSATQPQIAIGQSLESSPLTAIPEAIASGGATLPTSILDVVKEHLLRANTKRLAEITTGSARDAQALSKRAWDEYLPEIGKRTGIASLAQLFSGQ